MGIPGAIDLERTGGLAGRRVAQVVGDAAIFVAQLLDGVEGRIVAGNASDVRIQSATGDQQQREAGAGFLVMNTNGALFEKAHRGISPALIVPAAWRWRANVRVPVGRPHPRPSTASGRGSRARSLANSVADKIDVANRRSRD